MTYQIRHAEMGVYQGEILGMGFWSDISDMPEQGYCEFPTYEAASQYRAFLASDDCASPLKFDAMTIEEYDAMTSDQMRGAWTD